jgi:hypothetical protein
MLSHFPEKDKLLRCVTTQSSQRPPEPTNRSSCLYTAFWADRKWSDASIPTLFTLCGHSDGVGRWQSHHILTLCAPTATSSYPPRRR